MESAWNCTSTQGYDSRWAANASAPFAGGTGHWIPTGQMFGNDLNLTNPHKNLYWAGKSYKSQENSRKKSRKNLDFSRTFLELETHLFVSFFWKVSRTGNTSSWKFFWNIPKLYCTVLDTENQSIIGVSKFGARNINRVKVWKWEERSNGQTKWLCISCYKWVKRNLTNIL